MRIGLDAHILGKGKGGVERVVHQMVRLLPGLMPESQFVVFTKKDYTAPFAPRPNVRYRRLPVDDPLLQRSLVLPWLARRERLDLLHVQRAAPPCVRARLIVHTHDLLPLTAPADHQGFRDRLVRRLTPGSIRRANGVLTVSESVAAEIRQLFPQAADKLAAIPNGIDVNFFRPKPAGATRGAIHTRLNLAGDYVLYLGALMSRKNLEVAIRGFGQYLSNPSARGTKLVLAGMTRSREYETGLRALAGEVAPGAVVFTGFVTDEECLALLQHAAVFLAPSRGEGFDFPALEAMACAIPVICSELPVHHELLDDDALYFPTDQPAALAAALRLVNGDASLRARLIAGGPARAARYTWEDAMARIAAFYLKVHFRSAPALSTP